MLGVETSGAGAQRSPRARAAKLVRGHPLLLIVCLGAVIRFATLGTQDFWLDEHATLIVIAQGPLDLLKAVQLGESNPALYYVIAGAWERVFGDSEVGIRSLSAVAGIAAIPVLYAATKALYTRRAGLVAASLAATNPLLIWYSQETRNYSLLVFLSALSFLCFVRALDDRGQRWLWGWALASALALCTHYFSLALIIPEAAWLLLRKPGSRIDTALGIGAVGAVGVALLPLIATQRGRGDWIAHYSLPGRLLQLPEHSLVGLQVPWQALPAIVLAVVALIALYGGSKADEKGRRGLAIAGSILVAGMAMLLVAAAAGDDYIVTRNLLELWVPLAAVLGVALAARGAAGRIGTVLTIGVCAVGVGLVIWTAATPEAQRPNYSDLAAELGPASTERLIVSQTSFSSPLVLYLDGSRIATDEDLSASELVVIEPRPTESYAVGTCWWLSSCGGVDLQPPPRFEVPPEFELTRTGSTRLFDYRVYEAPRPTAIQRPVEYLTPRVFVQTPP